MMGLKEVKEYLKKWGLENRIIELDVSTATVELAARALGCESCRIAKTLALRVGNKAVLVVTAGDTRIDNKKFKARFRTKAKMLPYDETEPLIGHPGGGICPFAVNDGLEIYLDDSLKRFETIFPAAGSAGSAVELTIPELEICSNYKQWIDVCTEKS